MEVLDNLKSTMAEIFAKWHSNSAIKSDEIFKLRNLLGRQEMDNLKIKNSLANELHNVKILKKKEANLSDYIFKLQSRIDLIEKQALPKELCINKLSIVSTVASSTCCFSNRLECLKQLKQTILIKNEQARAVPNTARDHKSNFMASISSIWSKNNSKKFTPSPENVFYLRQKFMALLSFLESFYGIHVRNKDVDSRLRVIYSTALVAAEAKPHINP